MVLLLRSFPVATTFRASVVVVVVDRGVVNEFTKQQPPRDLLPQPNTNSRRTAAVAALDVVVVRELW